jgi:hypothetical protein
VTLAQPDATDALFPCPAWRAPFAVLAVRCPSGQVICSILNLVETFA